MEEYKTKEQMDANALAGLLSVLPEDGKTRIYDIVQGFVLATMSKQLKNSQN